MADLEPDKLAAVYARAAKIITVRGWSPEYSYHSGAPVDLPKALALAEAEVGYPASARSPGELLGDWAGAVPSSLGAHLDQDGALDLLENAMLDVANIIAGEQLPQPEKEEVVCAGCGKPFERRRGRQKYHAECKPEDPS